MVLKEPLHMRSVVMSSVVVHVMVRNILQRLMMSLLTFIKVLYPNGEFRSASRNISANSASKSEFTIGQ